MTTENGTSPVPNGPDAVRADAPAAPRETVLVPSKTGVGERIRRLLYIWVFSYESSYLPLLVLWALGAVWAGAEIIRALPKLTTRPETGVLSPYLPTIIGGQLLLGILHQFIVFRCIHVFDSQRTVWEPRFPNFIGTKLEWMLRILILLSLLGVGGEIPLIVKHIRDTWEGHLHEIPSFTYPLCSAILYFLLLAWDIAGALRRPEPKQRLNKLRHLFWHKWPPELHQVYFYSDLVCLLFWLVLLSWAREERVGGGGLLIILLLALLFTGVTIFRIVSHIRSQLRDMDEYNHTEKGPRMIL